MVDPRSVAPNLGNPISSGSVEVSAQIERQRRHKRISTPFVFFRDYSLVVKEGILLQRLQLSDLLYIYGSNNTAALFGVLGRRRPYRHDGHGSFHSTQS